MKKISFLLILISVLNVTNSTAQLQFFHYPADTTGWVYGSDHSDYRRAHYFNDSFVIATSASGENNYLYNSIPVTMYGAGSTFEASFDFKMDSLNSCSDGLTFWFFTSSLYNLGNSGKEGGSLGFPDTVQGFALPLQTTVCLNNIYMKKINSTGYSCCTSGDTDIATPLNSQTFLTDKKWHHCEISYNHGFITTTFDGGAVTMSGYTTITGTGHFGFMATNGGGYTRKMLKNIQISTTLGTPTDSTDSFAVYTYKLCNGPQITLQTHTYFSTYYISTYYGDGTHDTAMFKPGMIGGYATLNHSYQSPGTYTVKHVLYNGTTPIDSLHYTYENTFCATLPIKFYYDANNNAIKDASESFISQPIVAEVDSNGKPIDTISTTSGFYYNTHGVPGDIYRFKVLSAPGNMIVSSPSSGILSDTLQPGTFITPTKYFGLSCGTTGTSFDFSGHSVIPVTGVRDQWGDIYVYNTLCAPTTGTLTVSFSPKYIFKGDASPAPLSSTSSTITWSLAALSSMDASPAHIHYQVDYPGTPLAVADTVHSSIRVTPYTGDVDTINNTQIILDTVRAGCDPNEMSVSPIGNILSCTTLNYTINFENTGNDTAHNIYVMDTLSDNVDPNSLRIVMASAAMNISKLKYGTHNIIRFDFPGINLLDSSHQDACNGVVIFNINAKAGLPDGTTIFNHAGIFFDYNNVVMTDTVENIIGVTPINGAGITCVGTTDTLVDATTGGIWSASNAYATVLNGIITGISAGVDTISYTVASPCSSETQTKIITVGAVSAGAISGPSDVCNGSSITVSDAVAGGIWSSSNSSIAAITSSGTISGITIGSATISYTVSGSCGAGIISMSAVMSLTVDPAPAIYPVTGGGSICVGDTGVHIGISNSEVGINYQLYNGTSKIGSIIAGTSTALDMGLEATSGSYTVKASDPLATCTIAMAGSAAITVNPLPSIYSITGGGSLCSGDTGVHVGIGNSELSVSYQLYNGISKIGGLVAGTGTKLDMGLQTVAGTYTAIGINPATTCTSNMTRSIVVKVIPSVTPAVSITADADTVCIGKVVTVTAIPVGGGSSPGYLWSVNGLAAGAGSTYTYTPAAGDIISATLISSATCAKPDTVTQSFAMTVLPLLKPVISVSASPGATISSGEMATLTAAATGAGTTPAYQWTINSVTIPGASLSTYTSNTFSEGDVVSCTVTSGGECGGYTASNAVTIHISHLGINSLQHNNNYSIFPNPTTDELTIKTDQNAYNSFTITNSIGQVMMQQQLHAATTTISVKTLPAGLYYISLSGDSGVKVQKFVKM